METRIRQSFAKQSMMQTFGADLTRVTEGEVQITAPILPGSRQQHGESPMLRSRLRLATLPQAMRHSQKCRMITRS